MKELVGSRRLGGASGWLQMTTFIGILSGMWAGGTWFGARLANGHDEWSAAWLPLLVVSGVAFLQIVGALGVQRTPEHEEVKFQRAVLWEHFEQLKLLFSQRPIKSCGSRDYLFLVYVECSGVHFGNAQSRNSPGKCG